MMGSVTVLSTGTYSTIQDFGRLGYRKFGVPVSGVLDQQSGSLANHLLNNTQDEAMMEITLSGPKLLFKANTQICIAGADISPQLNGAPIAINQPMTVNDADILSFGTLSYGARAYLAVKGGFHVDRIMGSKSFYHPVTPFSTIRKNDIYYIDSYPNNIKLHSSLKVDKALFSERTIPCAKGPEHELVTTPDLEQLFNSEFVINQENNRMGYRLTGPPLTYPGNYNMLTSAVLPGTVQLTPSGQMIVLMQDCQTTGGYPRILQLSQQGINRLAQKKAGDLIQFELKKN